MSAVEPVNLSAIGVASATAGIGVGVVDTPLAGVFAAVVMACVLLYTEYLFARDGASEGEYREESGSGGQTTLQEFER